MFSNKSRLAKHTPRNGINREEYIGLLTDEFYETTNIECKEQVTANLANFSYDPINYPHLKKHLVFNLFTELLETRNNHLILHGVAGITNLCLDPDFQSQLLSSNCLELLGDLLLRSDTENNTDIVCNILTIFIQISLSRKDSTESPSVRQPIYSSEIIDKIKRHQTSIHKRIQNLATLFLSEYQPIS